MSESQTFTVTLEQQDEYAFLLRFDDAMPALLTDEPSPLGRGAGPNPARLLAASVANCLMASLIFALRKFKNDPGKVSATATGNLQRNEQGRWRVADVAVSLRLGVAAESLKHLERTLEQFEDFCVVTQSVRNGFPVIVTVRDHEGKILKGAAA